MKKNYEMDLTTGPLFSKMIRFTVPVMLSSLLQLLFNAADIIVVGRFEGDTALSAVGSNTALINLCVTFFMGLAVGVGVLVANYYGGGLNERLSKTVHTAIMLAVFSGLFLTVVGVIFAGQFLKWMNTPETIIDQAAVYLRIYFVGMISMMVYNFGSAILRAVGDTRRPLIYLTVAGVVNVILNLVFVIAFHMGVAGVALATVISQTLSAFLIVRCMKNSESVIKLCADKFKWDTDAALNILKIGVPASIQGILFSVSNVIIQSSVNGFGDLVVGGNTAASNIEGFVYVSMNAFYQTAISFTGQNIGAGKKERITKIMLASEALVFLVGGVFGNIVVLTGTSLLSIYTDSPAMIEYGMGRIEVVCRYYFLCGMMDVMVGVIRGMGYSIMPTLVSLGGVCGIRLVWIFTFFRQARFHEPFWLYITYPASWLITVLVHLICFMYIRKIRELYKKQE